MKIAITTSSFARYSDEPLKLLEQAGVEYVMNDKGRALTEEEAIQVLEGCHGVAAGTEPLTKKVMDALPDLKVISRCGTGMDNVDRAYAAEKGIEVRNTPDGPTLAVAELTLGLILTLLRQVPHQDRELRSGVWKKRMGNLLHGKNVAKNSGGAFKVALSISGVALEQLEIHAPAVIDLLHQLNETGCCEFLCEPYSHGLSSLANEDCFREEVLRQRDKMKQMFGKEPKVFRNSSLIYSDEIGGLVASMGFKGMLTEGAKHVLGWKSPHYVYHCNQAPSLKLLLRDFKLSDDISLRFSNSDWAEYPLFADKYINWIDALPQEEQVINIFMELSALGMAQPLSSNILEFMKALPECAKAKGITFSTPTEIVTKLKSVSQLDVAYPMSWVDEERDTSCWLGNVMQREAFNKLYSVAERVHLCDDRRIKQDWDYLQASNNFRFMTTKNNGMWLNRGIYDSPYDAFTNYMNILGDFIKRVDALYPVDVDSEELNSLLTTIKNQGDEITELEKILAKLQAKVEAAKKTAVKKATNAKEPVVKEVPATKSKPAAKKVKKATAESKKSTGKAKKAAVK